MAGRTPRDKLLWQLDKAAEDCKGILSRFENVEAIMEGSRPDVSEKLKVIGACLVEIHDAILEVRRMC